MNMELADNIVIFNDRLKNVRYLGRFLEIDRGKATIKKGFKWDGATWWHDGKRKGGRPVTWKATCFHDVLIKEKPPMLSNKTIDLIMYDELRAINYKWALAWYIAVRVVCITIGRWIGR